MSDMIVKVLASSSEANCVFISNGTYNILIDIGIQPTKAGKVLAENDIDPAELKGVFITHEHKDHVQGLSLANKYKIPVYSMSETIRAITKHEKTPRKIDHPHELPRTGGVTWGLGSKDHMTVRAFKVHHDAFDPVGYTVESGIHKVSVLMDTGKVTPDMIRSMAGSTVYVFECNHDIKMLQNGSYDPRTKQRILSDNGHLSNDAAAVALSQLITGKGEQIYLSHMSSKNNESDKARSAVRAALRQNGFIANKHYFLEVINDDREDNS